MLFSLFAKAYGRLLSARLAPIRQAPLAQAALTVSLFAVMAGLSGELRAVAAMGGPSYTGDTAKHLREIAHTYPDVARFIHLGYSREGRSIAAVVLSSHYDPSNPAIYFNGGHHGNEQASVVAVLGLLQHYVRQRHDPVIKSYLASHNFIFQPVVNPDGLANGTRSDSLGRDPNRDYPYLAGGKLTGGFELPETRIVAKVHDRYRIIGSFAVHSGMEGILWPWGFTDELNPHHRRFIELSSLTAKAMGFQYFRQSFFDYETKGEYIDWAYLKHGTMALTVEVSYEHTPQINRLNGIVGRAIKGASSFIATLIDSPSAIAH